MAAAAAEAPVGGWNSHFPFLLPRAEIPSPQGPKALYRAQVSQTCFPGAGRGRGPSELEVGLHFLLGEQSIFNYSFSPLGLGGGARCGTVRGSCTEKPMDL